VPRHFVKTASRQNSKVMKGQVHEMTKLTKCQNEQVTPRQNCLAPES
jgi:hypothetical protein